MNGETRHGVPCPGLVGLRLGCMMWISTADPVGSEQGLRDYQRQVYLGRVPKPVVPATQIVHLPTQPVGILSGGRQPSVFFGQAGQWHPTPTTERAAGVWSAPPQGPIEYRAMIAFEKPSEAELAMARQFWDKQRELYQQLVSLTPIQLSQFFDKDFSPLPVSGQLQPQDSHDYSI